MPQRNRQDGKRFQARTPMLWSAALALVGHAILLAGIGRLVTRNALGAGVDVDPLELAQLADVLMPAMPPLEGLVVQAVTEPAPEPPADTPNIAERSSDPVRPTVRRPQERGTPTPTPADQTRIGGATAPAEPGPATAAAVVPKPVTELPQVADPVPALPVPPMPDTGSAKPKETGTGIANAPKPDTAAPALLAATGPPRPPAGLPGTTQPSEIAPGVESGEVTALDARASERAQYLNSIRRKVQDAWRARDIYKQSVQKGMAERGVESLVMMRIRADGTVERANMLRASGVPALDDEAIAVCGRAAPFDRPPAEMLDDRGGVQFPVRFTITENLNGFQAQARKAIRERWRPSPAFSRAGDKERITVAKLLLTTQGVLARAQLVSSAGIDFLDQGAMAALTAGLRLPGPPDDYRSVAGLVPLLVEFRHTVRRPGVPPMGPPEVRVLKPTEQPQAR